MKQRIWLIAWNAKLKKGDLGLRKPALVEFNWRKIPLLESISSAGWLIQWGIFMQASIMQELSSKEIEETYQIPCEMKHVNLAEVVSGNGQGAQVAVCLTVGTGTGCLLINGEILHGFSNSACEVGYLHLQDGAFQDLAWRQLCWICCQAAWGPVEHEWSSHSRKRPREIPSVWQESIAWSATRQGACQYLLCCQSSSSHSCGKYGQEAILKPKFLLPSRILLFRA